MTLKCASVAHCLSSRLIPVFSNIFLNLAAWITHRYFKLSKTELIVLLSLQITKLKECTCPVLVMSVDPLVWFPRLKTSESISTPSAPSPTTNPSILLARVPRSVLLCCTCCNSDLQTMSLRRSWVFVVSVSTSSSFERVLFLNLSLKCHIVSNLQ